MPDCPEWLNRVIQRMLAKKPEERFSSAAELKRVLMQGDRIEEEKEPIAVHPKPVEKPPLQADEKLPAEKLTAL